MTRSRFVIALVAATTIGMAAQQPAAPRYLSAADILKLPSKPAVARLAYGSDPLQVGELRLPEGRGPFPVAVVIHGGCYQKRFADLHIMDAMSTALTGEGLATWNIEYRKIDEPGGAWPGMFRDVAAGVDYLRELAPKFPLDLTRVIAVGHSAGGHLALWAAARQKIPRESPLWVASPVAVRGGVNLDGPSNLQWLVERKGMLCGAQVMEGLVGSEPEAAKNLQTTSPLPMLPLGARQAMVYRGVANPWATPEEFATYAAAVTRAGDLVITSAVADVGHFEFLAPGSIAWPQVMRAIKWAIE
jgi:acetyl esterase/lipase